jgi:origin recognition complex subunit 4
MDTPRESKRRKLDTPGKESPAPAQSATRRKATPKAAPKAAPKAVLSGTPASRAKQARAGLSPFTHTKENAQPPDADVAETVASAPQSAVEKLKAKRQEQGAGSGEDARPPAEKAPETPSKSIKMAGFFKKFADPRLASMRAKEKGGSDEGASQVTNVIDIAEDDSDGGSAVSALRASGRRKQLSTKLREQAEKTQLASKTTPAAKKKKTFEDEIREVEAAARDEADAEVAGTTTPATQSNGRRIGSRSQTPKHNGAGVPSGQMTKEDGTPAATKTPAGRKTPTERKTPAEKKTPAGKGTPAGKTATSEKKPRGRPRKVAETITLAPQPVPEILLDGDVMEVDDSEEDRIAVARSTTPPAPVRSQLSLTPQKSAIIKARRPATEVDNLPLLDQAQMQLLQRMTLEKIYGKRLIPLANLNDEYTKVNTVISQTITAGESNSMLLIGGRGCGKTALVNHILREQAKEHPDDFHAVRLNGFIHTDDKIALREIWRQLGREMELDEEENTTRNYADTLASLLALLSHPLELGQEQAPGQTNKSVIFILDEFDLFASHPRQTLLYNLFDIAQSRKAPIAVLGLTTRIDVAESLEKRVKSRFSHRYVHLSSPKSLTAFIEVCKAALKVDEALLSDEEREILDRVADDDIEDTSRTAFDAWNAAIDGILSSEVVAALLHRIYYTTKSVNDLLAALLNPIATLPLSAGTHTSIQDHILTSLGPRLSPPDSKLTLLASLSTLQLALLICAARQTTIHNTESVSFNLAYEEYKLLASKAKIQAAASGAMGAGGRLWSKDVAKDAWMDLVDMGLMMDDVYSGRGGGGTAGRADVSLEEIGQSGIDLGSWGRWCKEI